MPRHLTLAFAGAALLAGCSTELEVNEPYKDITIVYGLLNQRDSLHFVKINKAFLGEGNAFTMAMVQDSSEYADEDITSAKVHRINSAGNVVESYDLHDTTVINREPGTFYSPVQKLYYFRTPFSQVLPPGSLGVPMYLWQDDTYELELQVKGRKVSAKTPITNDFRVDPVDQDTVANGARVNLRSANGSDYSAYELNWTSRADCKRFVVSWRLRYDEITGTDTVHKSITQLFSTRVSAFVNEDMAAQLSGESFYSTVASRIKAESGWQNVDRRIFRGLDFPITVANEDFHIYLTLTEPVTGIVNDRPSYSNLNDAIGVWGSRYTKTVVGKRLTTNSIEELINGTYTADLRFCSPQDAFPCP